MNHQLQDFARQQLKDGLAKLPEGHQLIFKRMYSHKDLQKPINDVVDAMPVDKLDWAMQQVENSLEKRRLQALSESVSTAGAAGVTGHD